MDEPKCNIQKENKMMSAVGQPPIITHTAATPQDSPNTTLDVGYRDLNYRAVFPAAALSFESIDRTGVCTTYRIRSSTLLWVARTCNSTFTRLRRPFSRSTQGRSSFPRQTRFLLLFFFPPPLRSRTRPRSSSRLVPTRYIIYPVKRIIHCYSIPLNLPTNEYFQSQCSIPSGLLKLPDNGSKFSTNNLTAGQYPRRISLVTAVVNPSSREFSNSR